MWLQGYDVDIVKPMPSFSYQPLLERLQRNRDRILPRFEGTEAYELVESIFGCVRVCLEGCETYRKLHSATSTIFERQEVKSAIREVNEAIADLYEDSLCDPASDDLDFLVDIQHALEERRAEISALRKKPQLPDGPFI